MVETVVVVDGGCSAVMDDIAVAGCRLAAVATIVVVGGRSTGNYPIVVAGGCSTAMDTRAGWCKRARSLFYCYITT